LPALVTRIGLIFWKFDPGSGGAATVSNTCFGFLQGGKYY